MSIIDRLATSLNFRGTEPNKQLAKELATTKDKKAIKELVDNLNNKDKRIQSDCIKVLYELGELDPSLIADHVKVFLQLLESKNNRMQWGAMTALDMITPEHPKLIYESLGKIIAVADKGSVITTDHCVSILLKLCRFKEYKDDAFSLFIEQIQECPTNQLPMYAENALPVIDSDNKAIFLKVLNSRIREIEKDSKRKRVDKVISKIK
jgi:hypothetical protein